MKNFEKLIDQLDEGNTQGVPADLQADFDLITSAVRYIGEEDLRGDLMTFHQSMKSSTSRFVWLSGIAACVAGLCIWWFTSLHNDAPILKMNEAPVFGDSATYDSIKNMPQPVDTLPELE